LPWCLLCAREKGYFCLTAKLKADAAVRQVGARSRSTRRVIVVVPGDTPDYRIKSAEVAGLDFEWRDRSHLPPRSRRRRLNNGTDSSFPRKRFGHSLNKIREQNNENSENKNLMPIKHQE